MKKRVFIIFMIVLAMVISVGCDKKEIESKIKDEKLELIITTSFTANSIPFFYMMENNLLGDDYDFKVEIHKTREEATAKILKGNANIAMLSVQEAANMYNKELSVKLVNGTYGASFYLMTKDDSIKEFDDLIGETLWTSMKGGPVAFTLNQLLINNADADIDSDKDIEYKFVNLSELTQMVLSDIKEINVFSLREPFVTKIMMSRDDIKIIKDFDKEWEKIFGHRIPLSGVVMSNELLNKDDFDVNYFNEKYDEAIKWVQNNPEEASVLGNKYLKGLSAKVLEKSIESMNLEIIDEMNLENELTDYFNKWLDFNPQMIGNKLPDNNFYYKK